MNKDTQKSIGTVTVEHWSTKRFLFFWRRKNKLISRETGHNLITSAGKAGEAGCVSGVGSVPVFTYLANGSSSTPATIGDTALGSENTTNGAGRHSATMSLITTVVTSDTLQAVYAWTATGAVTVNELGIFNNATAGMGTLLAHYILAGTVTLANTDQIQVTYQVQYV